MRIWMGLAAAVALLPAGASAQTPPHRAQARQIFERIVAFRTAKGHG